MSLSSALDQLLGLAPGLDRSRYPVEFIGHDPVCPSTFSLGAAASVALAAQSVAICEVWRQRTGREQSVSINVAAAALSLESVLLLRQRGYPVPYPDVTYPLTRFHTCRDGRSIFLHAGYPLLRNGLLDLLDCPNNLDAINAAVLQWNSFDLEDAAAERGLCAAVARSADEWLAHPQGALLATQPVVSIERIADSAPEPLAPGARPLSGVRVLDVTHVLAGPTATRTLAEQGASVLRVRSPSHPTIPGFVIDTGHGKLSTLLDLTAKADADCLRGLIGQADVFAQSYRPGAMSGLGFAAAEVAALRPGIIYLSLSCYGDEGLWGQRRGWEQLAQSATGMAVTEGSLDQPQASPVYPNDYLTGYLGAFGVTEALLRRAREGGSYHVKVSLSRTAMWLQSLPHFSPAPTDFQVPPGVAESMAIERDTAYGRLRYLGPVPRFSETQAYWSLPTAPVAANEASWPACPAEPQGPPMPVNAAAPR